MIFNRRVASLFTILALLAVAVIFLFFAYRRIGAPLRLIQNAVTVEGVITEKLIQSQRATPLPFDVPVYVVRYAFPTLQGQLRTGEQIVTRAAFNRLGDQGAPAPVTIHPDDPGTSAVDARITFPGVAGVRLAIAVIALGIAYFIFLFGILSKPRN